jgi:hypothetical protein
MTTPDPLGTRQRASLGVIRLSLLAGVLAFGAVTWFLHRGDAWTGPAREPGGAFATIALAVSILAIAGIVFARRQVTTTRDAGKYGSWCVIGWAFGELAALTGGVYYFLTDDPSRYLLGVLVMLLSFVLIPLRRM